MRHFATPDNNMAQTPIDREINILEAEFNLDGLIDALEESIQQSSAVSPTSESEGQSTESEETNKGPTRRNTMASLSIPPPDTTPPPIPNLTTEQLQQIITNLTGGKRRPKLKEPSVFTGKRDQFRG